MDLLQVGLIFLIALLAVFLTITGFQVFLILRDIKKTLDRLNQILFYDPREVKPYNETVMPQDSGAAIDRLKQSVKKTPKPASPRFFKKTL